MTRFSLIITLVVMTSGCVELRRHHSVVRAWANWNSFGQPALSCEKLYHQPYKPARVDHFRWMYNKPPGKMSGQSVVISGEMIDDVWQPPLPPAPTGLPPVPPPEAVEPPPSEAEPSIGPLPPLPDPVRESEPADDDVPAEVPDELQQTSYQNVEQVRPRGTDTAASIVRRVSPRKHRNRPIASWLFSRSSSLAVD